MHTQTADLFFEQYKKEKGKALAASHNFVILETFRELAKELGAVLLDVDIDKVRSLAESRGIEYKSGAWMGSIFKDGWICTGYKPSTHKGSHGRIVRVWRLKV